jgi:hypothetical protein
MPRIDCSEGQMRRVAVLTSVLITVVSSAATAQQDFSLVLQPSILTGGLSPIAIASGDLDGDGNIDLAVANYDSDDVSVLWGNGDGTFTVAATTFSVGSNPDGEAPVAIAIANIGGHLDGKLDIVTANESANTVTVLLNQGGRTFATSIESPTGGSPEALTLGDFNGDGKLDVATPNADVDTVTVLFGNADGTFSSAQPITVGIGVEPYGLVAVDLNHDQILDLVIANSAGGDNYTGSLTVLQGQGNGTFVCVAGSDPSCSAPEITSPTFDDPIAIAVGQGPTDLNGDQNPDLVVVNDYGDSLSVLLGQGNLTFQDAVALNLSPDSLPEGAVVADFNSDGIPDIASSASFLDKVSVFVGQGNGDFAATPVDFFLPVGSAPWGVTTGDFNGDGKPDLAAADFTDPAMVSVLLNACAGDCNGGGNVSVDEILTMVNIALGNLPVSGCQEGDVNGDGQITVDEILKAVSNALDGCGA